MISDNFDHVYLYGGSSDSFVYSDLWMFNTELSAWVLIENENPNGPGSRTEHQMIFNNGMIYFFGGSNANGNSMNDLWVYDLTSWSWLQLQSSSNENIISSRSSFFMNSVSLDSVYGEGFLITQGVFIDEYSDKITQRTDTFFYSISLNKYFNITSLSENITPGVRNSNNGIVLGSYFVASLGENPTNSPADCNAPTPQNPTYTTWILDLITFNWSLLSTKGTPLPLKNVAGDSSIVNGTSCGIFHGGYTWVCPGPGNVYNNNVYSFCL